MFVIPRNSPAKLNSSRPETQSHGLHLWPAVFGGWVGGWLGLALLKFGNPIILDRLVEQPKDIEEWIFQPWPVKWGYVLLGFGLVAALKTAKLKTHAPRWIIVLPLLWFGWQCLAAARTVDPTLTQPTLIHFASCVLCFYLGLFCFSQVPVFVPFCSALLLGFLLVLWLGFGQHYGGLEATRKQFYELPNWQTYPPDYLKKIASDRIFSSLVYPNALAAAILLYSPFLILTAWTITARLPRIMRGVLVGLMSYTVLACLYWTGSKAGWLIALIVTLVVLSHQPFPYKIKLAIISVVLIIGLAAFGFKFAAYFEKGATSAAARLNYWTAAWHIFLDHPVFGTGPGTFSIPFKRIKPPEAEMAKLTHNDYLEQACDSGIIGFCSYFALIAGSLLLLYRKSSHRLHDPFYAVWLGLCAWSLHSFVEFNLYIPALAWPAFLFFGWLWEILSSGEGTNQFDKHTPAR